MVGMMRYAAAVGFALLLVPGAALAAEVELAVSGAAEYDNNVGRTGTNESQDAVLRVLPQVRLIEDEGAVTYDLMYRPVYEYAVDTGFIDDFRHFARAGASWQLSERTEVFFNDRFSFSDVIDTVTLFDEVDNQSFLATNTANVIRNAATLGISHDITERLRGTASVTHRLFDSQLQDRSDNQSYGGTVNLSYLVTPRHRIGAGVSSTFQDLDESPSGRLPKSSTLFVNLFGTWTWVIDETMSFEVTVGPTFVDSDQPPAPSEVTLTTLGPVVRVAGRTFAAANDSCDEEVVNLDSCDFSVEVTGDPALMAFEMAPAASPFTIEDRTSTDDTAWTIFAQVELRKRWTPDLFSTLSYARRDSAASGIGGSTVLDLISFNTAWKIAERWDASVNGTVAIRDSLAPRNQVVGLTMMGDGGIALPGVVGTIDGFTGARQIVVENAVDTQRYNAAARLAYRATKNLTVATRYTFVHQESKIRSLGRSTDFTDHLVTLTVTYAFDRWKVW